MKEARCDVGAAQVERLLNGGQCLVPPPGIVAFTLLTMKRRIHTHIHTQGRAAINLFPAADW